MNFRLRYAFLFPGVNSRAELVPSHGASRRWLGDKVEYLDRIRQLQKFYQGRYLVILTDLCNAMNKIEEKISYTLLQNFINA